MRDDLVLGALAPPRVFETLLEQRTQLGGQRKDAAFTILRGAWLETDEAAFEVDLRPAEREDLRVAPPAGDVAELNGRPRSSRRPSACTLS